MAIGVRGPQGVGLLLGLRLRYLLASADVVPGLLHTLVVVSELDAHDGELRRVVEVRVRDGRGLLAGVLAGVAGPRSTAPLPSCPPGTRIVYSDLVGYQTSDIRLLWTIITRP